MKKLVIFLFSISIAHGQMVQIVTTSDINLTIGNTATEIRLRWQTADEDIWKAHTAAGYTIYREQLSGGTWQSSAGFPIDGGRIDTSAIGIWQPFFSINQYRVAFETFYNTLKNPIEDKFFAFYNASAAYNLNFDCAIKAGYGFKDANVITGVKYRYKIVSKTSTSVNSGAWVEIIKGNPINSLSIVESKQSSFSKTPRVNVEWDVNNILYAGYEIERSEDNVNFTKINLDYLIYTRQYNQNSKGIDTLVNPNKLSFTDSLPNITKTYYYRVKALSYLGYIVNMPPNSVQVKKYYFEEPHIEMVKNFNATSLKVDWTFPDSTNILAADEILVANGYIVEASQNNNQFRKVKDLIPNGTRTLNLERSLLMTYTLPNNILPYPFIDTTKTYYLRIGAITKTNDTLRSIGYAFSPIDRTAPTKPQNVLAEAPIINQATQKRTIKLTWTKGTETDLTRYVLKRKLSVSDSSTVIAIVKMSAALTQPSYIDTLSLKIEDIPKIYYSLNAVDASNNHSDPAEIESSIADNRRPMPPRILSLSRNQSSTNDTLKFKMSPELGTSHHIVRKIGSGGWVNIKDYLIDEKASQFVDVLVPSTTEKQTVYYSMYSKDAAGNLSCFKDLVTSDNLILGQDSSCFQVLMTTLVGTGFSNPTVVQNFTLSKSIGKVELSFGIINTFRNEVNEIEIYKKSNLSDKETLWKIHRFTPPTNATDPIPLLIIEDETPITGQNHIYVIRASLKDGRSSSFLTSSIIY